MNHRERDEPGGEEQLISQRVQHGPKPSILILHAGDRPIERISESGHDKGGNDRRALSGCQRLAVGPAPPYNRAVEHSI